MYAGWESPGGPWERLSYCANDAKVIAAGDSIVCSAKGVDAVGEGMVGPSLGEVPLCGQFNEQHNLAAATCGVLFLLSARLQQSMSSIPFI
jgi:hypothetical protein